MSKGVTDKTKKLCIMCIKLLNEYKPLKFIVQELYGKSRNKGDYDSKLSRFKRDILPRVDVIVSIKKSSKVDKLTRAGKKRMKEYWDTRREYSDRLIEASAKGQDTIKIERDFESKLNATKSPIWIEKMYSKNSEEKEKSLGKVVLIDDKKLLTLWMKSQKSIFNRDWDLPKIIVERLAENGYFIGHLINYLTESLDTTRHDFNLERILGMDYVIAVISRRDKINESIRKNKFKKLYPGYGDYLKLLLNYGDFLVFHRDIFKDRTIVAFEESLSSPFFSWE